MSHFDSDDEQPTPSPVHPESRVEGWSKRHADVESRLLKLDLRLSGTEGSVEVLKERVDSMMPKPKTTSSILLSMLPFFLVLAGFVWQAARYPDRPEFEAIKRETTASQKVFQEEQAQIHGAVYTTIEIVKRLEARQEKVDDKLSELLERRNRR